MVTKIWDYLEVLTSPDLNDTFAECATLVGTETLTNKKLQLQNADATPEANTMVNEAIIKAWGYIKADETIESSYNVDSVSISSGLIDITLKRAFSDTNYIVVAMAEQNASADNGANMTLATKNAAKTTSTFRLECSDADFTYFYFMAIGLQ